MRRAAVVVLMLLLLSGCGGRSSGSGDTVFVKRADAVCAKRAAAVSALPYPSTGHDLLDLGRRVSALEEREQSRLVRLEVPGGRQVEMAAFLRSIDRVQRANAIFRDAFIRSNATDLARARVDLASAREASNAAALRLGLACRH
jgi:hypothetical protein